MGAEVFARPRDSISCDMAKCIDCGRPVLSPYPDGRYRGDRCIGCTLRLIKHRRCQRERPHAGRLTRCVVCGEPFFDALTLEYLKRKPRLLKDTLKGLRRGVVDQDGRALRSDRKTCSPRCRQRLARESER